MTSPFALLDSMPPLPDASSPEDRMQDCEQLKKQFYEAGNDHTCLDALFSHKNASALLKHIVHHSPYLTRLLMHHPLVFPEFCRYGPDHCMAPLTQRLTSPDTLSLPDTQLGTLLRNSKQQIALITALADMAGIWPLERVTQALSDFAATATQTVLDRLLFKYYKEKTITLISPEQPSQHSGIVILGMGKLGAGELNYSSDIDLIMLYEPDKLNYQGRKSTQHFLNKLAQELVWLMQERTQDGYVFRTDLRLRPDPASTPLAVPLDSAIRYYESVGQNWERAAMIKARQIAGDDESGQQVVDFLERFIWRKHLDFAAITDIHSIKRQMNTRVGNSTIAEGHNVKTGIGGIREIEFFVQTHQLIRGGRTPSLRHRSTVDTLNALCDERIISEEERDSMTNAYRWLRHIEHRLQMIDDQQTHSLPDDTGMLEQIAPFLGYETIEHFRKDFNHTVRQVHTIYTDSMEGGPPLTSIGNLVFTGVEADPDTLKTLESLGFQSGKSISDTIQNWHRGSRRATRSQRARELLTELIPAILESLADTANPDTAFFRFDEFLSKLPAGVQIFSLFSANPELLKLLATILGSAPALGETISKNPLLLDAVIEGEFFEPLADKQTLTIQLTDKLAQAHDYEDATHILRTFKHEKTFSAGVHMLKQLANVSEVNLFLSDLADAILHETMQWVTREFTDQYGIIEGGQFAIIALGKLGSRELTFNSDLDLMFVYDAADLGSASDGRKSIDARSYYHRLTQRLMTAITMKTREGDLYEVDTRLRPNGVDGPIASTLDGFTTYFTDSAWTFEYMALTRARVVYGTDSDFSDILTAFIDEQLRRPRDRDTLIEDIYAMRTKITETYYSDNPWDIKHVRGGLIDLDFICQYLQLRYAHKHPDMLTTSATDMLNIAAKHDILSAGQTQELVSARVMLSDMLSLLRLCSDPRQMQHHIPMGLQQLLLTQFDATDFDALLTKLVETETKVLHYFDNMTQL